MHLLNTSLLKTDHRYHNEELPDHTAAQVAPVMTHMALLYSLCKPNKLVLSQERPPESPF